MKYEAKKLIKNTLNCFDNWSALAIGLPLNKVVIRLKSYHLIALKILPNYYFRDLNHKFLHLIFTHLQRACEIAQSQRIYLILRPDPKVLCPPLNSQENSASHQFDIDILNNFCIQFTI